MKTNHDIIITGLAPCKHLLFAAEADNTTHADKNRYFLYPSYLSVTLPQE